MEIYAKLHSPSADEVKGVQFDIINHIMYTVFGLLSHNVLFSFLSKVPVINWAAQ